MQFVQVNPTGRTMEARAGRREPKLANDRAAPPHRLDLSGHALVLSCLADDELGQGALPS